MNAIGSPGDLTGRSQRRRRRPALRPRCEGLEDRRLLAVTAVLNDTTLEVSMSAAGDVATIENSDIGISVNGESFAGVEAIDVTGADDPNQVVDLDGSVTLGNALDIQGVSSVNVNGTWQTSALSVSLSDNAGGMTEAGGLTVSGDAVFAFVAAASQNLTLGGTNTFGGNVNVSGANNVVLTTGGGLNLQALQIVDSAVLTSSALKLTASPGVLAYASQQLGELTLQPAALSGTIHIGGTGAGYVVTQSTLTALKFFGGLTVGRDNAPYTVAIDQAVSLPISTTLLTAAPGAIHIKGVVTATGGLTLGGSSATTTVSANIKAGGPVVFEGPVVIAKPAASNEVQITGGGAVAFEGTLNAAVAQSPALVVTSPLGDIAFGTVGDRTPLSRLTVGNNASAITFNGPVTVGSLVAKAARGPITINGAIKTQGTGVPVDLATLSEITIGGSIEAGVQTVRLEGDAGISGTSAIQAGTLVVKSNANVDLDSTGNRVLRLAGNAEGSVSFADHGPLSIVPFLTFAGIGSGGAVTINDAGALTLEGRIFTLNGTVILDATSVSETANGGLAANGVLIRTTAGVAMTSRNNLINTLAATAAGPFAFRNGRNLTVGTVAGVAGIATGGGNAELQVPSSNSLILNASLSTAPGTGGKLKITGRPEHVIQNVKPTLGKGNITLVISNTAALHPPLTEHHRRHF
jgi:hypothetical protein